jgi:two-component system cell cycle sensor histidine kinase/response regulator CckA
MALQHDAVPARLSLSESEDRLRVALDAAGIGVVQWEPATGRLAYGGHVRGVFGRDADDLPDTMDALLALVHPDDRPRIEGQVRAIVKAPITQGGTFDAELRVVQPDGTYLWIAAQGQRFFDKHGNLARFVVVGRNTTPGHLLEEESESRGRLLNAVLANAPDSIYAKDLQGRYVLNNAMNLRLLGLRVAADVHGKTVFDLFPPEIAERFDADDRHVLTTGQAVVNREEPHLKDAQGRQRWFLTTKVPLREADGQIIGLLGISRDISDWKRLEQQLLQAQKMETVGRLAGGVAHDFNNLLTIILGSLELLRVGHRARAASHLENIETAATQAAHLTRQLLAFSRQQIVEPKVVDVNELINDARRMLSRLINEDIELMTRPRPGLWRVSVDPMQLMQVLVNLVVNARDAMPHGGKLTIETDNVTLGEDYIDRHSHVKPGEFVMLAVSDNGCGLSDEARAHLFEPFFTTKELGKGTGLGLATSYGIVKQSGGFIFPYSEAGKGATFKVYLPRATAEIKAMPERDRDRERVSTMEVSVLPRGAETVLLVEDNDLLRQMATETLERHGYTVIAARDGVDALTLIDRQPERDRRPVHLLLTDVIMPNMSGRELAGNFQRRFPDVRVLYMSGYASDAIVHHGMLDPGIELLQKPYTPLALIRRVQEVLGTATRARTGAAHS